MDYDATCDNGGTSDSCCDCSDECVPNKGMVLARSGHCFAKVMRGNFLFFSRVVRGAGYMQGRVICAKMWYLMGFFFFSFLGFNFFFSQSQCFSG